MSAYLKKLYGHRVIGWLVDVYLSLVLSGLFAMLAYALDFGWWGFLQSLPYLPISPYYVAAYLPSFMGLASAAHSALVLGMAASGITVLAWHKSRTTRILGMLLLALPMFEVLMFVTSI